MEPTSLSSDAGRAIAATSGPVIRSGNRREIYLLPAPERLLRCTALTGPGFSFTVNIDELYFAGRGWRFLPARGAAAELYPITLPG